MEKGSSSVNGNKRNNRENVYDDYKIEEIEERILSLGGDDIEYHTSIYYKKITFTMPTSSLHDDDFKKSIGLKPGYLLTYSNKGRHRYGTVKIPRNEGLSYFFVGFSMIILSILILYLFHIGITRELIVLTLTHLNVFIN